MTKQFPCPVTTIFSRRVKAGYENDYEQWLKDITNVSNSFKGNQGTTIIRPSGNNLEYISVVQFDSTENLENWLNSELRAEWINKLDTITLDSQEVTTLTGMEKWFTLPDRSISQAPPKYKTAILLVLGLYPLVLLLDYILSPFVSDWSYLIQILLSIILSVPIMVWLIMPWLTRLFFKWLYPS
ncbi:MAG: antibiotic biosynthesis monooxygenase [Gammaproteobacteria bacterium]|nr:antibiotic biosynthesis monooxygenase [Gammaproteobacteria bacterium]